MTGAETTIFHLHVKNLPAKYLVHPPNIFRKKSFFLTLVKPFMLKCLPVCQRFNEENLQNPCFLPLVLDAATLDRFPLFKKLAGLKSIICLSVTRATLAPDFWFLKNSLLRTRDNI